jgi:hypothetical protein
MLKSLTREVTLAIQTKSGLSAAVLGWIAVAGLAALVAFIFLCVTGYDWLAMRFGSVFAGLIMTGVFVAIAVIAAISSAITRRNVRQRAILARAAKAHSPTTWLFDPKILGVAMQAGRTVGWQRIVPVVLLGFLAAQWAREYRNKNDQHS